MTPDLAKLKALAEAAIKGGAPNLWWNFDRDYIDEFGTSSCAYLEAANPTTILALLSTLTRVEDERDDALKFRAAQLNEHERRAFNDGVEAAAKVAFKHDYVSLGQGVAVRDAIRDLTRPTTQPEKDKS